LDIPEDFSRFFEFNEIFRGELNSLVRWFFFQGKLSSKQNHLFQGLRQVFCLLIYLRQGKLTQDFNSKTLPF
jgi:hypothetical protein